MILAAIIITFLYSALITSLIIGFDSVTPFHTVKPSHDTNFSIIIPFRNEASDLPTLLHSLEALAYPTENYELIFVDDASEDISAQIINDFFANSHCKFKVIENERTSNSPKKDAIYTAIQQASSDWILTTDADCSIPKKWLQTFDHFIKKKNPKLIVGPVTYSSKNTLLERFQHIDFLSLMGSTIGGFGIQKPFLCNGANLCYSKQTFFKIKGFEGNTNIASGDDIFLLEKMVQQYPDDVHYLKSDDAVVITQPQPTLSKLIQQRTRWAAKSTAYTNTFSRLVSVIILGMNTFVLVLLFGILFHFNLSYVLLIVFSIKFCIDFLLIWSAGSFFKQRNVIWYYPISSLLYPLFIMFVLINSLKSRYSWKGRTFKK